MTRDVYKNIEKADSFIDSKLLKWVEKMLHLYEDGKDLLKEECKAKLQKVGFSFFFFLGKGVCEYQISYIFDDFSS